MIKLGTALKGYLNLIKIRNIDIKFVLKRTVVYSIFIIAISFIYVSIVIYLGHYFEEIGDGISLVVASIVIVLTLIPLQRFFTNLTNRIFFKKPYNLGNMRERYSKGLARLVPLDKLAERIVAIVYKPMQLTSASILVINPVDNKFSVMSAHCQINQPYFQEFTELRNKQMTLSSLLLEPLREGQMLFPRDLARLIQKSGLTAEQREKCKAAIYQMLELHAKVLIPAVFKTESESKLLGILSLGKKRSGDKFSNEDLRFFDDLAAFTAVALNSSLKEKELAETQAKLAVKEALAEIGEQTGKISHDICNYLNPTQIFSGLLSREMQKGTLALPSNLLSYHGFVPASIKKIIELLDWLKNHASGKPNIFEKIDINKFLTETKPYYEVLRPHKGIKLVFELNAVPEIMGIKVYLGRMFLNLIVNAFDAIGKKSGTVTVRTLCDEHSVIIKVINAGEVISPENLARLFKQNFTTKEKGTGQGMTIIKEAVNIHAGEVWVESRAEEGTTFTIKLPKQ